MRKHMPSLNQLRAFEATARNLSFSKAADELHVTHAAVSHQVKALEDYLQTTLFDRLTRSIKLTADGRRYFHDARKALDIIEVSTAVFFENRATGNLTISVAPSFATRWLLPRLEDFHRQYPDIRVDLQPSMEITDFRNTDLDLAIRHGKGRWAGSKSEKLFDEYLVPVAAPGLAASLETGKIEQQTLLSASPRKQEWQQWIENITGKPANDLTVILYPTQALALDAAVAGGGVALADHRLIETDVAEGRLVVLHDEPTPNNQGFYVSYRRGQVVELKIKLFCEWLKNRLE